MVTAISGYKMEGQQLISMTAIIDIPEGGTGHSACERFGHAPTRKRLPLSLLAPQKPYSPLRAHRIFPIRWLDEHILYI